MVESNAIIMELS